MDIWPLLIMSVVVPFCLDNQNDSRDCQMSLGGLGENLPGWEQALDTLEIQSPSCPTQETRFLSDRYTVLLSRSGDGRKKSAGDCPDRYQQELQEQKGHYIDPSPKPALHSKSQDTEQRTWNLQAFLFTRCMNRKEGGGKSGLHLFLIPWNVNVLPMKAAAVALSGGPEQFTNYGF